jgi:hypothetical protein
MLSWAIESVRMLLRSLLPVLILLARVMRVATSKLLPTMFLNNYEGRILSDVGMEMKEPFRLRKERMRKGKNDFLFHRFLFCLGAECAGLSSGGDFKKLLRCFLILICSPFPKKDKKKNQ